MASTVCDVWTLDPEAIHEFLEDWARLEADFDDGPDSDAFEVSARIAKRLRMSMDRISDARRVRNRCAHLDANLTDREIAQSRNVLDEALMRYLSVDVLDQRRIADEAAWEQQGRASRRDRHDYLVKYTQLLDDARDFEDIGEPAARHLTRADFRRCRKVRDQISHPSPPPLQADVDGAIRIIAGIESALRKEEDARLAAEAEERAAELEREQAAQRQAARDHAARKKTAARSPSQGKAPTPTPTSGTGKPKSTAPKPPAARPVCPQCQTVGYGPSPGLYQCGHSTARAAHQVAVDTQGVAGVSSAGSGDHPGQPGTRQADAVVRSCPTCRRALSVDGAGRYAVCSCGAVVDLVDTTPAKKPLPICPQCQTSGPIVLGLYRCGHSVGVSASKADDQSLVCPRCHARGRHTTPDKYSCGHLIHLSTPTPAQPRVTPPQATPAPSSSDSSGCGGLLVMIALGAALVFLWPLLGFVFQAVFIGGIPALILGVVGFLILKVMSWWNS